MIFSAQRKLRINENEILTPILVPSFSSKGFPKLNEIISTAEDFITDIILVSAYDIYYQHIDSQIIFPEYIILDSGGYEAGKDTDFADLGFPIHHPGPWNEEFYKTVLDGWDPNLPTLAVSFDHPQNRSSIPQQIEKAHNLFEGKDNFSKTFLLKPERIGQIHLDLQPIIENITLLDEFDVIGVTDKEMGESMLKRMLNIANLRKALNEANINRPIHVFGSLDPVTTVLYFIAGADIFDGLTWLRYAFRDGKVEFMETHGVLNFEIDTDIDFIRVNTWVENYYYINRLQQQMEKFNSTKDFSAFDYHSEFIEEKINELSKRLEE